MRMIVPAYIHTYTLYISDWVIMLQIVLRLRLFAEHQVSLILSTGGGSMSELLALTCKKCSLYVWYGTCDPQVEPL